MADVDRCVCCGEMIPEGGMVCPQCEYLFYKLPVGRALKQCEKEKSR